MYLLFANITTFGIFGTHLWPLSVYHIIREMTRTERKQFNQIKYKLTKTKKTDHCESMTVGAKEKKTN